MTWLVSCVTLMHEAPLCHRMTTTFRKDMQKTFVLDSVWLFTLQTEIAMAHFERRNVASDEKNQHTVMNLTASKYYCTYGCKLICTCILMNKICF